MDNMSKRDAIDVLLNWQDRLLTFNSFTQTQEEVDTFTKAIRIAIHSLLLSSSPTITNLDQTKELEQKIQTLKEELDMARELYRKVRDKNYEYCRAYTNIIEELKRLNFNFSSKEAT